MGTKRRYRIDPAVARERSIIASRARTTPDYFIRKLAEAAETLTDEQVARLAAVLAAALHTPAGAQ